MKELEAELKELIVVTLSLDDLSPDEIDTDEPIFGERFGLDSIDALELAMAIEREYGVRIKAENEKRNDIFRSVRSLAEHVIQHRRKGTGDIDD